MERTTERCRSIHPGLYLMINFIDLGLNGVFRISLKTLGLGCDGRNVVLRIEFPN